jgi:hypothetical protein
MDAAIMLVDRFSRVAWVDGYVEFIQNLHGLFAAPELKQKAIVATLVLAAHPEARPWLISVNLAAILRGIPMDPAFEGYRQSLLRAVALATAAGSGMSQ